MGRTHFNQHSRADFPGESSFFVPVQILSADADIETLRRVHRDVNAQICWTDNDFVAAVVFDERKKVKEEITGLVGRLVHFPVSGNKLFSHEGPFSKRMDFSLASFSAALT